MNRNYLMLFGLMLIFILTGYFVFFYTPIENIKIRPNVEILKPISKNVLQNENETIKEIENNLNNKKQL